MNLYHFTCDHGAEGIQRDGLVRPFANPWLGQVAWFTDLEEPTADDIGLTSTFLSCDRLTHRFQVESTVPHRWLGSVEQACTPFDLQRDLHRYGKPQHWWIAREAVPIV